MVNFCAISAEGVEAFDRLRKQVIEYKMTNPNLKVIAGGCIEGLSEKKDLDFADAVFHHQGEAEVFATVLGKDDAPALAPFIMNGAVQINISQGCNNRCTFCKVHYLENMQLTSRPMEEILDLARRAISGGCKIVSLIAENSTEYGTDIGTSLTDLLQRLLELDGLRLLDVDGVCLDEVTPELLRVLQHPKIRTIQIEAQSLDDQIRKNMGLKKTTAEALEILNVLSGKALISNFMIGFRGIRLMNLTARCEKFATTIFIILRLIRMTIHQGRRAISFISRSIVRRRCIIRLFLCRRSSGSVNCCWSNLCGSSLSKRRWFRRRTVKLFFRCLIMLWKFMLDGIRYAVVR